MPIDYIDTARVVAVAPVIRVVSVLLPDRGEDNSVLYTYRFDPKYAADTDGFTFDIRAWLGDIDQISGTPTVTVTPTDVTVQSVVVNGGFVSICISGGTVSRTYQIELHVTTTGLPPNLLARNCRIRGTFAVVA